MNRKYLLFIIVGIFLICIIAISFYFKKQSSSEVIQEFRSALPTPNAQKNPLGNAQNVTPTLEVSPEMSPSDVAKMFYAWYIAYPKNVLQSGAYKTNPYITDEFKQLMTGFAIGRQDNIYDPIFCTANKTKNFAVAEPIYMQSDTQATVNITKTNGDTVQNLYHVVLKHISTGWKIDDVICIPQN